MLLFRWFLSHLTWFSLLLLTLYGLYKYLPKLGLTNHSVQNPNSSIESSNKLDDKYNTINNLTDKNSTEQENNFVDTQEKFIVKQDSIKKQFITHPIKLSKNTLPKDIKKEAKKQIKKQVSSNQLDSHKVKQSTNVVVQKNTKIDSKISQQAIHQFQKKGYDDLQDMLKMLKQQK